MNIPIGYGLAGEKRADKRGQKSHAQADDKFYNDGRLHNDIIARLKILVNKNNNLAII